MFRKISLFLILFLCFSYDVIGQLNERCLGTWEGVLSVNNTDLRIIFHIKSKNGVLMATMDSPDQLQYDIKMDTVIADNEGFLLKLALASAEYKGKYRVDSLKVNGHWKQAGKSFKLNLKKNESFLGRKFPQEPKAPFPYKAEEVLYKNKKADITIGGTLTVPEEDKKYPVILLITGSGAQDRDENIAGHKPFWVIADHFSRRGFAVLRVDDRGIGASGGNPQTATTADFVTDVKAGIAFLKSHPSVDPTKIFLMGHSEGGLIAMMVAAEMKKGVAGIISLAGPGVPMQELIVRQSSDILLRSGKDLNQIKVLESFNRKFYSTIANDKKNKLSAMDLYNKVLPDFNAIPKTVRDSLEFGEARLMQSCVTVMMPWFRYFIKINPNPYLKKIKCPVLALNGSEDIQVAAGPNLEAICSVLRSKKTVDVTCSEIPGLNHLFQHCESCDIMEYGQLEETFAPKVLKAIEGWIVKRTE